MTTLNHAEDIADDPNQKALEELARAIEWDVGQFALILARCNSANWRSHLIQRLREICPVEIREIVLDKSVKTLYSTIQAEFYQVQPQALMVCGLESVSTLDRLLTGANQVREEFRKNFHFPLVWWVTDEVLQKLIRLAPDLQSWFTTVEFEIATEELIHCIQKTAEDVFAKVLDTGAGIFLDHAALNLGTGSTPCSELESARHELESRGIRLDSELEASLEFVLGRAADNSIEESRHHFERSLALWRQQERSEEETFNSENVPPLTHSYQGGESHTPTSATPPYQGTDQTNQNFPPYQGGDRGGQNPKSLERIGCVLHSLGLWWRSYAERHRAEYEVTCSRAKGYFQQCVEVFEQAQRPDLVAKFINALGEILQRLQQWNELELVAQKALSLHQTYPDSIRLARAYGFLAEVALAKSAWADARQAAETALSILINVQSPPSNAILSEQSANLDWVRSYHQGWYLFSLARAHSSLGQVQEAIASLETAAAETKPYYDPELYIRILEELRSLYFKQGDYLKAFHIKQELRSIEQQYGFRAFVGAGRLQPKQEVANPALPGISLQGTVAQEIAASGRQQDVNRLVERIGRSDHKLTVIQGQSGVGKSSLVQAGLIPALKQKAIGTRDVVPVLQQVYTDWVRGMGKCLREALVDVQILPPEPETLDSLSSILDQLRKNAEQNLLTVLIFDQFEEFFFVCKDPIQRLPFYEFLRDAMDVPYAKVILSLREDYLYFLLECNDRIISFDIINNNILDKTILYYLGNFSVEDAKSVIQNLTELTQFPLEPALIDALVQDLAGELGEVRPIELQVVGAQLQTEKITKLEQYQKYGPKEKLVERFLEEVVKDCGPGNEQIAKLVLYLLTDENNTRPLKTRSDLELELDVSSEKLDLVLEIFVKSRLVFQVPALPVDRYQLVHDYLVAFVRQQQSARLVAELEKEREQRKLSEARLNQVLKQQLRSARRATITLAGLLVTIGGVALIATVAGINLYLTNLSTSSAQNRQIERVVSALKAAKRFKQLSIAAIPIPGTKLRVLAELNQAVSLVEESNRLEGVNGVVKQISFSPDGKMIATVSEDGTAQVWSIDGSEIPFDEGQKVTVTSANFSPDGKLLATATKDGRVILWDINDRKITKLNDWSAHKGSTTNISFSPDSKMLATAGKDKTVAIWKIDSTKITRLEEVKGFNEPVTLLSFSPDGKTLATSSQFDIVKLWNLQGNPINSIDNYGAMIMRFSSDSKTITLVNKDGAIKLWSIKNGLIKNTNPCNSTTFNAVSLSSDENVLVYTITGRVYKNYILVGSPPDMGCYDFSLLNSLNNDSITDLSFSPDGKWLASASKDKIVKVWSVDKVKAFNLLKEGKSRITRVRYSGDSNTIAIGRADNTVEIRERDSTLSKTIPADSSVLSFSPDSKTLATGSTQDIITLWSSDGKAIRLQAPIDNIQNLNVSPDGQSIVVASGDNKVKLWHRNNRFFIDLPGYINSVKSVNFSPDSQIIAAIDANNKVLLWHSDGSSIETQQEYTKEVTDVFFSPNSQFIASFGNDNVVNLWRRDGKLIKTLIEHKDRVTSVSFSPDSSLFASVTNGGGRPENSEIKLWRSKDGNSLGKPIENYGIQSANFSPDGRTIASINADNTVKLWGLEGNPLATLRHNDQINSLSFSRDRKRIATASNDGTVGLWRSDGQKITFLRGHTDAVYSVSFSSDGKILASASKDQTVKLWESSNGSFINSLPVYKGAKTDNIDNHLVSFSADDKFITSVSGDWSGGRYKSNYTVNIWRGDGDYKQLETFSGRGDYGSVNPGDNWLDAFKKVSFSADGKTIALARRDHAINLWNLDSNKKLTLPSHENWVNSVSFSSDGKLIASGSDDGILKLWRSVDGKLLNTIKAHSEKVNSVSFSPDGRMIASASDDKTVKLWNSRGTPYKPFPKIDGLNEKVTSVRFSPDSKTLAYANESGTVRLWSISNRKDVKELQKLDNSISEIDALNFSQDGNRLALGGNGMSSTHLYIPNGFWFKATQLYNTGFSSAHFSASNDAITVTSNDGKLLLSPSLDELMKQGCDWARDYLKTNPKVEESDRTLCDDIPPQK